MIRTNQTLLIAGLLTLGVFFASPAGASSVLINEIAWMGTSNSANDEWIELYNGGTEDVDLTGWTIEAADGTPTINIAEKAVVSPPIIAAGGFLLLERTDDTSVPGVGADVIYTGALENSGEVLVLKNADGTQVDKIDGEDNWKINGASETIGDNTTKETAQRTASGWLTAPATPRATNVGSQEPPAPTPAPTPGPQPEAGPPPAETQKPEPESEIFLVPSGQSAAPEANITEEMPPPNSSDKAPNSEPDSQRAFSVDTNAPGEDQEASQTPPPKKKTSQLQASVVSPLSSQADNLEKSLKADSVQSDSPEPKKSFVKNILPWLGGVLLLSLFMGGAYTLWFSKRKKK